MLNLEKCSTKLKPILGIAVMMLAVGLPSTVRGQGTSSAASDWASVSKALNDARSIYERECPTNASCSPASSDLHKLRVAAFERARDLLERYNADWVKDPTSQQAVRLYYYLGQASEGAELHNEALANYTRCWTNADLHMTFREGTREQPLKDLCSAAMTHECHVLTCPVDSVRTSAPKQITRHPTYTNKLPDAVTERDLKKTYDSLSPEDKQKVNDYLKDRSHPQ